MRIFLCQNGPSLSFASLPKLSSQPTVVTLTRACLNTHTAFGRGEPEFLSPFLELLSTPTMSLLQTHNSGSRWPTSQAASRAKLMIITQRTLCAPLYVSGRWRLHNYLFSTCVVLHPTIHQPANKQQWDKQGCCFGNFLLRPYASSSPKLPPENIQGI